MTPQQLREVAVREGRELIRREAAYRGGRPPLDVAGKTVIVVDDGLATGSGMLAAVRALREAEPSGIVIAVPAAPESTCRELSGIAVIAFHPFWRGAAATIISILGWVTAARGFFLLAFPDTFASVADRAIGAAAVWQTVSVMIAVVGVYLTFIGWVPARSRLPNYASRPDIDIPRAA